MTEFLRDASGDGPTRVLLAHGAGAPMDSPFMNTVAAGLAQRGLAVARFEFAYMKERRAHGVRRGPDRLPVLTRAFLDAIAELGAGGELVIGGKSMGGRIASMVADEVGAKGLLVFGYPFHPTGKPQQLRTRHLSALQTPSLFVQGTRDNMGTRHEVSHYALPASIEFFWIEDGDHSLKPRKRSGQSEAEALASAIDAAAAFVQRRFGTR